MKIGIFCDNTLALQVDTLCVVLNGVCKGIKFSPGQAAVRLDVAEISMPDTYERLPRPFKKEAQAYDLAIVATATPYDNNYFFQAVDNVAIVSFFAWNVLTDLPISNGLVYFIASMLCDRHGLGKTHQENAGCLNDFLADKTGVDAGMRAAYLCRACRRDFESGSDIVANVEALLDLVAYSSRAGRDLLLSRPAQNVSEEKSFDAFMCHNSADKPEIRKINLALQTAGVRTWLDEEQVALGKVWQVELEDQIERVTAACVFVGAEGVGPWHHVEIRAFLSSFVERDCRVIPVLLPGAPTVPKLPIFLKQLMWVDLRRQYAEGMESLTRTLKTLRDGPARF